MTRDFLVAGLLLVAAVPGCASSYSGHAEANTFIDEMVSRHHFAADALRKTFADAQRQQSVLDAIARPAERRLAWKEYRALFLGAERIEQGVAFWNQHAALLDRAAAQYGVDVPIIVGVLGVETRYGARTGNYRVLDALSTLAFDYPPRAKFFRGELEQFLLLAREEGADLGTFTGSYAGAMGWGQFIPSSYRNFAVDFDADGKRDIWNNPADAIGSIGNYLAKHHFRAGEPIAVRLPSLADAQARLATEDLKPATTIADLRAAGIDTGKLDAALEAQVFRLEGADGTEYWLGLHNLYVISRYNRSRLYTMAVTHLGEAIAAKRQATVAAP